MSVQLWGVLNEYFEFICIFPESRDNGNDFSFPFPFPFPKLNDPDDKTCQSGYPTILNQLFSFPGTRLVGYF